MRTRTSFLILLMLLIGSTDVAAKTWSVAVGGTTSGGGYGGYDDPVLAFAPAQLTINVGDSVTFTNLGGAAHNVHADDDSFRCAAGCDDSGGDGSPSSSDWLFTRTFNTPGTIHYHCDVHASMGMVGSIVVNPAASTFDLGGYLSGNWYDPGANQAGHGFQLEFTNAPGVTAGRKVLVAIWFVFTPTGEPVWVYGQGEYDPTSNTTTIPSEVYSGAKFPPNYNAADRQQLPLTTTPPGWGNLTFTFSDCNHGTAQWVPSAAAGALGYTSGSVPIQRLTMIDGTSCPP